MGIPAILAGILTQLGLYSINLRIMGNRANQALSATQYDLLISLRNVKGVPFYENTLLICLILIVLLIAVLYWFFGTALGCSIRLDRLQSKHVPCAGDQHGFLQAAGG